MFLFRNREFAEIGPDTHPIYKTLREKSPQFEIRNYFFPVYFAFISKDNRFFFNFRFGI